MNRDRTAPGISPMSILRPSLYGSLSAIALLLGACAGDISPGSSGSDDGSGGETPETATLPGPGGAQAAFSKNADGSYHADIDASGDDWVYLDLETQTQVTPQDPAASDAWDIALQGVEIKLNGGVSGAPPGGYGVAVYAQKTENPDTPYPFDEVSQAPTSNAVDYVTDTEGGLSTLGQPVLAMTTYPDADVSPDPLTGAGDYGWYHYSGYIAGSEISARSNVGYVVRTVECRYFNLRMTAYTDAAGTRKHPQFDLLEIPGPGDCDASPGDGDASVAPLGRASFSSDSSSTLANVDAGSEDEWVYLDLTNAMQVAPTSPASDANGWDIALQRTDIKLNGGSSGSGSVELHDGLRDDWDARTRVPADAEWHTDAADALAFITYPPREIGGECAFDADGDYGWYYYSGFCDKGDGNHYISPRDVVYLLRGRDGNQWKLRLLAYYGSDGSPAQFKIEYAPITDTP
jgi:hypothetical protein